VRASGRKLTQTPATGQSGVFAGRKGRRTEKKFTALYDPTDGNTNDDDDGTSGDLKKAIIKDPASNVLDTKYYRYYIDTAQGKGYAGGLKLVLEPASHARWVAADPSTDIDTISDTTLKEYSDLYLEYGTDLSSTNAVSLVVVQGAGCSACTGGQGTFAYSYSTSGNTEGYNNWDTKTIESLPDPRSDPPDQPDYESKCRFYERLRPGAPPRV
jgi:hypothetical protein